MTRFARAKGSKSSNQKAPEDSTPWEVMKEQINQSKKEIEDAKLRKEAEQQRIENYNNFLKDQKVQKRKATWCDFPEVEPNKNQDGSTKQHSETNIKKKKKGKSKNFDNVLSESQEEPQLLTNESNNSNTQKKKEKCNKFTKQKLSNEEEIIGNPIMKTMKSVTANSEQTECNKKPKHKKKKKNSSQSEKKSENVEDKNQNTESHNNELNVESGNKQQENKNINQKLKKKRNKEQKQMRRKEINDRSFQLIINGKEIELERYDGFPIMKKDAERLKELKNNMIKKGIPKSEVQRNMKLERRRAEKALARLKREVCYNCRKGGHNLSDCPDLKSKIPGVDGAEGICFKCGSTEHRQFECKVQRDKEFRFATCFICKEAGHIARQCPDNPKGLYPNGGCCKLCGDVTHLKKDCPTTKDKKEESSIKLQTLDGAENIEDIGQKEDNVKEVMKKPKKIKF